MGFWDKWNEASSKVREHGGNIVDWFHGIGFVKAIGGLAVLAITGLIVFAGLSEIPNLIEQKQHQIAIENCECENYDVNYISYDTERKCLVTRCDFCRKEMNFPATIEYPKFQNYEPTCIKDGLYTEKWTFVDMPGREYYYSYSIPAISHKLGTILVDRVEPTCTEKGHTESGYCLYCYGLIESMVIEPLGHNYETIGSESPTCSSVGYTGVSGCTRCYTYEGINEEIPMLNHTPVHGTFEATYSNEGFIGDKCEVCDMPINIEESLSDILGSEFFSYEIIDDEYAVILEILKETEELIIPDYINGYPVTSIQTGLFQNNTILKSITLSKNLIEISDDAFNGCVNLKKINIPNSVVYIGANAFLNCSSLRFVDLGISVELIGNNAFVGCNSILSFRFSQNLDFDCITANNVFDATSLYSIGNCYSIPVIYVPKKMMNIAYFVKRDYTYNVNDKNEYVIEQNGYYFYCDGGKKELLGCDIEILKNGILNVPDGTDIIGYNFFYHNSNVVGIILPESVYWIKEGFIGEKEYEQNGRIKVFYLGNLDEYWFINVEQLHLIDPVYLGKIPYEQYTNDQWYINEDGNVMIN